MPAKGLDAGDIGTVVHVHRDGAGYEVEFMTLAGETIGVVTLMLSQLRPIARRDIAHVRELLPLPPDGAAAVSGRGTRGAQLLILDARLRYAVPGFTTYFGNR